MDLHEVFLVSQIAGKSNTNGGNVDLSNYYTKSQTDGLISGKVDKISGMGLSENNFTNSEKTKLSELANKKYLDEQSIPSGADLNGYISENFQVYYTNSQAITQSIINKPADVTNNRFTLETWKNGGLNYIQRLTYCSFSGTVPPAIYIRSASKSTASAEAVWTEWYKFAPEKVENNVNALNMEEKL